MFENYWTTNFIRMESHSIDKNIKCPWKASSLVMSNTSFTGTEFASASMIYLVILANNT